MLTRTFVCEVHQDFGHVGWRPTWQPTFDPLPGMAVAHDILEHFPDDRGLMSDEFQALGASVHIRGLSYWYNRQAGNGETARHIAADLPDILIRAYHNDEALRWPGPTKALDDEEAEEIVQQAVRIGLREFGVLVEGQGIPSPDHDWVEGWMRIGFRRAIRRYRRHCRYDLADVFTQIADEADRLLKQTIEGDRLKVSVSLKRRFAKLDLIEQEEEFA